MLPETNSPIDFLPIDTFNLLSLDKGSSYVIERFLNADTAILEIKWDATKDELKQTEHVYMRRALRGRKTYFAIDPDNNLMADLQDAPQRRVKDQLRPLGSATA